MTIIYHILFNYNYSLILYFINLIKCILKSKKHTLMIKIIKGYRKLGTLKNVKSFFKFLLFDFHS